MSFHTYNTLDGANCQTVDGRKLTQRKVAIEVIKDIGLRQICEIDLSIFGDHNEERAMFQRRLERTAKAGNAVI